MHYGFGGFGMIIFWVTIIAVAVILIKLLIDSTRGNKSRDKTPLDILRERYAKGDISRDEYISRTEDLNKRQA